MADTPGEGKHARDQSEHEDEDDPVSEARVEHLAARRIPPQLAQMLDSRIPNLAERVTRRVQAEIPEYAGPSSGRRHGLIAMAIREAASLLLRRLSGRTTSAGGVDDLFHRMGYGEATDGHDPSVLEKALRIAGREAWQGAQQAVITAGLPASTLGQLGDELNALLDHLASQAREGHAMALRLRERDVTINRALLLEALLHGADPATVHRHAQLAGWPVPAKAVLIAATSSTPVSWPDNDDLEGGALSQASTDPAYFLTSEDHAHEVIAQLSALDEHVRLAHAWPVPLTEIPQAQRWVSRALELAVVGAVPNQRVIDCTDHRTQLWLHSEPLLRRQLAQELLKPLFAEAPNSREILSETLLAWLETRESAPALGAILGVHPQTVRYRWKRLHDLFGQSLQDPEFVVQLTLVLKASVPLWIAGDQSDFERYLSEETR